MKIGWCLILVAGAVTLFTGPAATDQELMDEPIHRLGGIQYGNQWDRALPTNEEIQPVVGFNRGAVEHRPDPDDVRRAKTQFTRDQPLSLVIEDYQNDDTFYQSDESDRSTGFYVEEQAEYPESYQGFNGHSIQRQAPVVDLLEPLFDPVPIDPSSVTRNGKRPLLS